MSKKQDDFHAIMEVANQIVEHDPRGLVPFVRLCGMAAVARFLSWRLRSRRESAPCRTDVDYLLFPLHRPIGPDGKNLRGLCPETVGIVWVSNGNHSITAGIIRGEGKLRVGTIRDIRPVYQHVRYDGEHFHRSHDGSVIEPVRDPEFAAIFEVGRFMLKHSVA